MERLFSLHCEIWVKLSSISTLDTPLRPKTSKYPKGVYTSLGVYTSFHYVYGRGAFCGRAKHNRPLYHTGYIGEAPLPRVQVDPGSAVNVMPLKALAFLEIPAN